jgi:type I restriction enzyme S subunit
MGVTELAPADATHPVELPRGWRVTTLGEIASVSAGGTPSRAVRAYWDGVIPWITTSQIDFNTIREAEQYISEVGLRHSAAKMLPPGCLLMALYGQGKTRGKVAMLGVAAATNQACAAIVARPEVSSEYLFHFLASRYDEIRSKSNIGNQDNLNGAIVRSIEVVLPPLAEQREIARALTETDRLIEAIDRQVLKTQAIKRAAMQELLTARIRLPGFDAPWRSCELGDVAMALKGRGLSKARLTTRGASRCVLYGELFTTYGRVITKVVSRTDEAGGMRSEAGDVLLPGSTTTTGIDLATASALLERNVLLGGDINVVRRRGRGFDPVFLAYYLSEQQRRAIADLAQGITIVHLYGRDLLSLDIVVPSVQEQAAIGRVLMTFEDEIAALEREAEKVGALKQAMMQLLLSGQSRLLNEVPAR